MSTRRAGCSAPWRHPNRAGGWLFRPTRFLGMMMLKNGLLLFAAFVAAFSWPLLAPADPPKDKGDKAEADLVKALKDADAVFTAKVGKVEPLGQTNSIPASVFGKVSFKDPKALRGE